MCQVGSPYGNHSHLLKRNTGTKHNRGCTLPRRFFLYPFAEPLYSLFRAKAVLALAALFSLAASFFCLLDLGGAFCCFFVFCSLFAIKIHPTFHKARERACRASCSRAGWTEKVPEPT